MEFAVRPPYEYLQTRLFLPIQFQSTDLLRYRTVVVNGFTCPATVSIKHSSLGDYVLYSPFIACLELFRLFDTSTKDAASFSQLRRIRVIEIGTKVSALLLWLCDLKSLVHTGAVREDLLAAGWPIDLDAIDFFGIAQAKIQRENALRQVTGFAVVVL